MVAVEGIALKPKLFRKVFEPFPLMAVANYVKPVVGELGLDLLPYPKKPVRPLVIMGETPAEQDAFLLLEGGLLYGETGIDYGNNLVRV
jgi:hypothetical protein